MSDRRRLCRRVASRRLSETLASVSECLWNVQQAAEFLGVSTRWLRSARLEIPRAIIAGKLRFRPSQVRHLVTQQTEASQPARKMDLTDLIAPALNSSKR